MSDQREAGDNTIGAHEVAMAKYNLGAAGRLLERMEGEITKLRTEVFMRSAIINMLVRRTGTVSVTEDVFMKELRGPELFEIDHADGVFAIRPKEGTA